MPESVPRLAFSPTEVAQALGCSRQHVTALLRDGTIPSLRLGRRRLIRAEALSAALAALEHAGTVTP